MCCFFHLVVGLVCIVLGLLILVKFLKILLVEITLISNMNFSQFYSISNFNDPETPESPLIKSIYNPGFNIPVPTGMELIP
jgi:hypothetical protein